MTTDKQEMRRHVAALKRGVSPQAKSAEQLAVMSLIEAWEPFTAAHTILAYHALRDELPTADMLDRWRNTLGKRVLLPRVMPGGTLELADMAMGLSDDNRYHILEPTGPAVSVAEVELAVIPAIAVDRQGHRLGRGGGYYDRLLPQLRCPVIAAVLACQLVDNVPAMAHDIAVDAIVTRDGLITTPQHHSATV